MVSTIVTCALILFDFGAIEIVCLLTFTLYFSLIGCRHREVGLGCIVRQLQFVRCDVNTPSTGIHVLRIVE